MKGTLSTILVTGFVFFSILESLGMAQSTKQEVTKDNQEQKRSSSGFEDDQSAICLSATRQAKMIASPVPFPTRVFGTTVPRILAGWQEVTTNIRWRYPQCVITANRFIDS
jgi:hypothetical protein